MVCLKTSEFPFVSFSISWSSGKLSFAMISLCGRTGKCQDGGLGPKWGSAEGSKPTFPSPFTETGSEVLGGWQKFSATF